MAGDEISKGEECRKSGKKVSAKKLKAEDSGRSPFIEEEAREVVKCGRRCMTMVRGQRKKD